VSYDTAAKLLFQQDATRLPNGLTVDPEKIDLSEKSALALLFRKEQKLSQDEVTKLDFVNKLESYINYLDKNSGMESPSRTSLLS
jgi:hypothetical protein